MPKGVEHVQTAIDYTDTLVAFLSLMPKGVEHLELL
jgi:hypothetical protein